MYNKEACLQEFKKNCPKAFSWHHYDLAEKTTIKDAQDWKLFLTDPEINKWIQTELNVLQSAELNKLLQNISESQSTGKAQIITALSKLLEDSPNEKTGPAFIYSYVPLNEQQEQAENVIKLDIDPFLK